MIIKKILLTIGIIVISIFILLWVGAIIFTKMDIKDYYYAESKINNFKNKKNVIPYYLNESFDIYKRRNIDTQDEWTKFNLNKIDFQGYSDTLNLLTIDDLDIDIYGLYNSPLLFTNENPSWWPENLKGKNVLRHAQLNRYIVGKYYYDLTDEVGYYRFCFLNPADTTVFWFTYRVFK